MDENLDGTLDEKVKDQEGEQKQESQSGPTAVELEAREGGWVPLDEFDGDENKWVDAAEFVRRGPLFEKINTQSREIKAMRKAIADIQELHKNVREKEFKRALEELKAEKKAALVDGDADALIEVDEKIDLMKEAQRESAANTDEAQSTGEAHPEFVAWVNKNTWYNSHKGMRAYADGIGRDYRASGLSPAEVLKAVERDVRKEFAARFTNPNQNKPGAVEGSGATGKSKASSDSFVLTEEERKVMHNLVRLNVLTEKDYIAEIKKTRGA